MEDLLIIATYENPDLDGVACAFAYEEYLNKTGKHAKFVLFGNYQDEVDFLTKKFSILIQPNEFDDFKSNKIALVDASDLRGLSKKINPKNIVEVIDHRKYYNPNEFPNALFQIELVGAAATLIAEKFFKENIEISFDSSVLLYYAIVSNTINFKAKVTTERDIKLSEWLREQLRDNANFIEEIFEYKTNKLKVSKQSFLDSFSSFFKIGGKQIGIIQLEITNVDKFISENYQRCLSIMQKIKEEFALDMIFITHIDLLKGFNKFFADGTETQKMLSAIFAVPFEKSIAKRDGVIMRKEIVPLIKAYYNEEI
jgi:inorganic pyrophosphatase/exopolyphosphatase